MTDAIDKSKVAEMLAWVDTLVVRIQDDDHFVDTDASAEALRMLALEEIVTTGGSLEGHTCYEMSKPERGLVRIKQQEANPNDRLGVVRKATWLVTDLGRGVLVAHRKRERKAEIRRAAAPALTVVR